MTRNVVILSRAIFWFVTSPLKARVGSGFGGKITKLIAKQNIKYLCNVIFKEKNN